MFTATIFENIATAMELSMPIQGNLSLSLLGDVTPIG